MACTKECVLIAGIGGMMPTVARLASTYVTDPSTPLPNIGLLFGLFLFFVIGSVLAWAFSEINVRQAFIIGVCAPGIITNIVAGVSDAQTRSARLGILSYMASATPAFAQVGLAQVNPATRPHREKTNEPTRIGISSSVTGATTWDLQRLPVAVRVIGRGGHIISQTTLWPGSKLVMEIPTSAQEIEFRAGNRSSTQKLPSEPFSYADISANIVVGGRNDFFWGLGANRQPSVSSIQVSIQAVSNAPDRR